MSNQSYNYNLHLPNGRIHNIEYQLDDDQKSNSLEFFLQKLEIQDPNLRLEVRKGQLYDRDHSEITAYSFLFMDDDVDLYLELPDYKSMFKLLK